MKAVAINRHGGLDCINVQDVSEPQPADNEILLEVRSAALNHLDIWVRKGLRGVEQEMPHIPGSDASGVIIDKGGQAHGFDIGEEVIVNPGLSCGCCEHCLRGQQSQCVRFGIMGVSKPGTFAEKVAVPFTNVYPKPEYMDFDEAAALSLAYQTAWRMLFTRGQLKAGLTVLIHGIGGGVALAACILAKLGGARVIVSSSSDEKLSKAAEKGADYTINYQTSDVVQMVKDITNGRGVDIIIDTVGAATWESNFQNVRKGGSIVICGVTTGPDARTNLQALYWNQLNIMGSTMGSEEDFRLMYKAVTSAKIKPVIDSVVPIERAREAMERMEKGRQFGKIVLKVSG